MIFGETWYHEGIIFWLCFTSLDNDLGQVWIEAEDYKNILLSWTILNAYWLTTFSDFWLGNALSIVAGSCVYVVEPGTLNKYKIM